MVGRKPNPVGEGGSWKTRKAWAPDEEAYLLSHWDEKPIGWIASKLRRSRRAVSQRAAKLGLPAQTPDEADCDAPILAACIPTIAEPGTPEKVEVLRYRVSKGQELWHDDDPTVRTYKSSESPFFSQGIRQYMIDEDDEPVTIEERDDEE